MAERQVIPLGDAALQLWRGNVDHARAVRKTVSKWWDANLKKYAPGPTDDPENYGAQVNTNRDYTLVERKKSDLFYQRPDVSAIPSPLFAGQEALLDTHTQILNEKLGPDDVHAKQLAHQVLFDVLCPSGTGWTVMGYESTTVDTETLDPLTQQPISVPVPIHERCFWEWFSPKQALVPPDFRSTVWDKAPWLGYDFEVALRVAKRKKWVPEDFDGTAPDDNIRFQYGLTTQTGDAVVRCSLIYYKSALYRDDQIHPEHYTLLILVDGVSQPAVHMDSPYQTLDEQGRLTPDSVLGNIIHPCSPKGMSDTAFPPSACTVSRPLVNELNRFRQQMVEQRDTQLLIGVYNTDVMPVDAVTKAVKAPINGLVGVPGDAFVGDGPIKPIERGPYPRENFTVNDYLDNDLARTWALDQNQQGVSSEGDATATEQQLQQSNSNAVMGMDRGFVLDWYIRGVTKYSALLQRYLPVEQAAQIVGQPAAQEWDTWRKGVPATLAFTALPDSTLRSDLAWERKRALDEYTFFANDPFINRLELLRALLPRLNYPQKVINAMPPEKSPEPTKPGLSLKGEDLNPLMPQFPILVEVLGQCGIKISPEAIAQAQEAAMNQMLAQQVAAAANPQEGGEGQTEHGGKVAQMEGLSKHQTDATGNMQGSGSPAPMGAGGVM